MKKIILFAICVCFLIGPIYSDSFQEYLQKQEKEYDEFVKNQDQEFNNFAKEQERKLKEFLKSRELNFNKYWGLVNEESFDDTKKQSDDEEPLPFRAKFSICFNCADTGVDLQVAPEDEEKARPAVWETAKNKCTQKGDGWYLPTKEELIRIYKSKEAMGGFSNAEYWSISEEWNPSDRDTTLAETVNFKDGKDRSYNKKDAKQVRCVRRIPNSQGDSKKIVVDNDKTPKKESKEDNVQQPKPVVKAEDKTPKKESKKEEVKQPKAVAKGEDKTPKDAGKSKDANNGPIVFTPGEFIRPVENCRRITSNFGLRQKIVNGKLVQGTGNHKGIDISCKPMEGKSVIAAVAGKVIFTGFDRGYGNYIRVEHPDGSRTIYGHLSQILTKQGDNIAQAQEIGKAGCTGNCTGAHLHFEVRNSKNEPLDPLKFLPPMDPKK